MSTSAVDKPTEVGQEETSQEEGLTEDEYCATCRPCCTLPHGALSAATATVAIIAWVFSLMTMASCKFMRADFEYCEPAQPLYGKCGTCHCILEGNQTCPSGEGNVPIEIYPQESIDQWKGLNFTNPYNISCNPYKNETCETDPPQQYIELWEDAVCAVKYTGGTPSFTNESECPTSYEVISYPNLTAAEEDGAFITHYGSCGVCSSLQDLAVYVENPDLTAAGQECGITGLVDANAGIQCFMEIGYTRPCAVMWMYNVFNTRDKCFDICVDFTFEGDPNNGPPPSCEIAPCLQCDEEESGPFFMKVAARTRRRSGLLSKIARPCDRILIVPHSNPCPVNNGNTSSLEDPEPTCQQLQADVGVLRYAQVQSNVLFDIDFLLSRDQKLTRSFYTTCVRYNLRNAVGGFWQQVSETLGAPHSVAVASVLISSILGGIATVLVWSTTCAAFRQNFWTAMAVCFLIAGIFQFLVLVFLASGICPEGGCEKLESFPATIVAGVFWFIAAVLAWMTRGPAKPGQTVGCCCCPQYGMDTGAAEMKPLIRGSKVTSAATQISITETVQPDGSKLTEKITKHPDGSQTVETITTKFAGVGTGKSSTLLSGTAAEPEKPEGDPEDFSENL